MLEYSSEITTELSINTKQRVFFVNELPVEKRNSSGIYKIENKINGKVYVGKTVNFRKRYVSYKASYYNRTERQINFYLMNSIDKYSPENFTFSVLEFCGIDDLAEKELSWMLEYVVPDGTELAGRKADESIYETGEYHRGGLYMYEVFDGQNTEEMLGKDLRIMLPNIYHVFCKAKSDTVEHKGYTVTRRKIE